MAHTKITIQLNKKQYDTVAEAAVQSGMIVEDFCKTVSTHAATKMLEITTQKNNKDT